MADKSKKQGRNKDKCLAYRNAEKHPMSHIRRLVRHFRRVKAWDVLKRQPVRTDQATQRDALRAWDKWMASVPNHLILKAIRRATGQGAT